MPLVEVAALNKSYHVGLQTLHVLRDLALDVQAGEMVAIMGPSGVGKSTLLHVLGGLDRADSGSVRIGETEITALADTALVEFRNRYVGFVFQFHHLLPEFDAAENAEMPMRIARIPLADARHRAVELLQRVGLGERLVHRPSMLSGGEQQRVAVARSLVGAPSVILADEPTAALDSENGLAVMALLSQIAKDKSRAVLAVTHDPRTVPYADRILRIEDGLIVGEERRAEGVETVHELARNRKRKANA
jgi:putative ABC transport system ATP-binding protein